MSTVGNRFAYRERVRAYGEPLRPVEITKQGPPRSNKARVRWLDGEYEGLEEWVPKMRLLAPWEEAEALLEDERRMLASDVASEDGGSDKVKWEAVEKIFGTLSRISGPSEDIILGYNVVEGDCWRSRTWMRQRGGSAWTKKSARRASRLRGPLRPVQGPVPDDRQGG